MIITQEPFDRFASNFDQETQRNHGMFSGSTFIGKKTKLVIYDQARVNGCSNYEYPEQRRVLKL